MKQIITILIVLLSVGSLVSAVIPTYNETGSLDCFKNAGLGSVFCVVGNGFGAWTGGSSILATILIIFFGIALGWKMHIPLDALALFIFFLLATGNITLGVTDWLVWLVIVIFGVISAVGIYHWVRR